MNCEVCKTELDECPMCDLMLCECNEDEHIEECHSGKENRDELPLKGRKNEKILPILQK